MSVHYRSLANVLMCRFACTEISVTWRRRSGSICWPTVRRSCLQRSWRDWRRTLSMDSSHGEWTLVSSLVLMEPHSTQLRVLGQYVIHWFSWCWEMYVSKIQKHRWWMKSLKCMLQIHCIKFGIRRYYNYNSVNIYVTLCGPCAARQYLLAWKWIYHVLIKKEWCMSNEISKMDIIMFNPETCQISHCLECSVHVIYVLDTIISTHNKCVICPRHTHIYTQQMCYIPRHTHIYTQQMCYMS